MTPAKPGLGTRLIFALPTVLLSLATLAAAASRLLRPEPPAAPASSAAMMAAEAMPHVDPVMPPPAATTAEQNRLYRTPGGLYTAADIRANGPLLPSERFGSVPIQHDLHPAPGTLLCPVTKTKANPGVVWTIGGKRYLFCCPSCIDEFVRRAHDAPQTLPPPSELVQR